MMVDTNLCGRETHDWAEFSRWDVLERLSPPPLTRSTRVRAAVANLFGPVEEYVCTHDYVLHLMSVWAARRGGATERDPRVEVKALRQVVGELRKLVQELQERVQTLEAREGNVIVVRSLSRDEAKAEVLAYFREHPDSYPSDVAAELSLDAALVRDLAQELVADGRLQG